MPRVAVVIPCYKVSRHILAVLSGIGPEVMAIVVVDDACPERTGDLVERDCRDPRVVVVRHEKNGGVGAAVLSGYRKAIELDADIIVKLDGDGQMDAALLPRFVHPIQSGIADYTKGNRFYDLRQIGRMPHARMFGNAVLSFLGKASTGYWDVFDPTNGYTAIDAKVAAMLPHDRISQRYFFETDMLFRLGTFRAVVMDIPMDARYEDEISNLHIRKIVGEFLLKHARNLLKRIFYGYFLRDMSIASLELLVGMGMFAFGVGFGLFHWWHAFATGTATPIGTVMLAAMPTLVGLQLILAFLSYDIAAVPRLPLSRRLRDQPRVVGR